ncbi:hypothetical protein ACTDI4_03575 [Mesorhizobium sp. PUT5]|uniref:hypothetical protein n=1 Tax=Mesorhizobium sp. PUT5 TaxID=3454629 RepID=UPI003FA416AB
MPLTGAICTLRAMAAVDEEGLDWALAVIEPALVLGDRGFLLEMRTRLAAEGVAAAVLDRDSAAIYDWLLHAMQHQGISDAAAEAFVHTNAPVGWAGISDTLPIRGRPACPRLKSYWHFDGCGYRKTARTCAEPALLEACPLPRQPLRNGRLSQGAYSLLLFIRDVCDGDIVGWIDARLEQADHRLADPQHRAAVMRQAVLEPMRNIHGVSDKVLAMALSTLLIGTANGRERWLTTGIGMIVIDTLVHNFLHRTGILQRLKANHPYGPGCYGAGGCADIVAALADRIDARRFNPGFPACFPRFVQHALWRFCAQGEFDICNGNRIDDRQPCRSTCCPAAGLCCRIALHGAAKPPRQ